MLDAAEYLANHIHKAPVWIVPCLEGATPTRTSGSSICPAVQNMLLAARALGLGATLTTLYLNFEKEVEAALGMPPNVHSYALLPIGYPIVRLSEDGVPATPAELMRHLQQWCEIQFAEQPADSTLKSKLRKLYAALRRPDEN